MSEIYALDVDWDFLMHLADDASWQAIRDERISEELLEDETVRAAYRFQLEHQRKHGKPATGTVLEDEFKEEQVGVIPPQSAIGDLIDRLRRRYANNQGREKVLKIVEAHLDEPVDLAKAMLESGRDLHNLLAVRGKSFGASDYEKAISRYHSSVVQGSGPSLGFRELDDYFYGQRGLSFLVGAPKSFKSWFTVRAVLENVRNGHFPYLYSLELPAEETDMRLRCMAADVPYWKYLQHQLDPRDILALEESSEILENTGQYFIDKPQAGDRGVDSLVERARDAGADCIFIDQLQYIENDRGVAVGATNDTKDYFQVINAMRDYSDKGPIWCVHQFNRSIMNADKMPEMQQIKGSAAVEECATLALGLWASPEMRKSNLVHLGVLTSRNYGYKNWEAQVRMRTGCGIIVNKEVAEVES